VYDPSFWIGTFGGTGGDVYLLRASVMSSAEIFPSICLIVTLTALSPFV
jgi:hypothetical protein